MSRIYKDPDPISARRIVDQTNDVLVAFSTEVHCDVVEETLPEVGFSPDATSFTCYVQGKVDDFLDGFKSESVLWMHYLRQNFGMNRETCRWVRTILGKNDSPEECHPEEAYQAGERLTFARISDLIDASESAQLDDATIGKILFLFACLIHGVQDKKHLDGNPEGITQIEHILPPAWRHILTDRDPPQPMRNQAALRTQELVVRLEDYLQRKYGANRGKELMARMRKFDLRGKRVEAFLPDRKWIKTFVPSFRPNTAPPLRGNG